MSRAVIKQNGLLSVYSTSLYNFIGSLSRRSHQSGGVLKMAIPYPFTTFA